MKKYTMKLADFEDLCRRCLRAAGFDEPNAAAMVRTVSAAERDECHSHGLLRVPGYVRSCKIGKSNGHADPSSRQIAPGVLAVDGDNGFAPLALERTIAPLAELARTQGLAAAAVTNTHHFAALWPEIEALTEHGLCAMAFTSAFPIVPPAGGSQRLFGTNPIAFGWPRADGPGVIFDQATAAMAHGEVLMAGREGRQLPPGTAIDRNGRPTNDPADVAGGAILAFGGRKGALMSMMVELLAGALLGETFSFEVAQKVEADGLANRGGELIIAMDPGRFGDAGGWADHGEKLFAEMLQQDGVRLPSQRRYEARARTLASGEISLAPDLLEQVIKIAEAG